MSTALTHAFSCTPHPHNGLLVGTTNYVTLDHLAESVHATLLGGTTRRAVAATLDSETYLGVTYFKFTRKEGRKVGDRVAVECGEELELARVEEVVMGEEGTTYKCIVDDGTGVTVPVDRCWLMNSPHSESNGSDPCFPVLYALNETTPPNSGYALDYLCLLSHSYLVSSDMPSEDANDKTPSIVEREWSSNGSDPHMGVALMRPAPIHLVSISKRVENVRKCTVVGYAAGSRREIPMFLVRFEESEWMEELTVEEVGRGVEEVRKGRGAVGAKELGYDVQEIITERSKGSGSGSANGGAFETQLNTCIKGAGVAAIGECEWALHWKLLQSRANKGLKEHADMKGVTKGQAWGRIKAGCVLWLRGMVNDCGSTSVSGSAKKEMEKCLKGIGMDPSLGPEGVVMGQKVMESFVGREASPRVVMQIVKDGVGGLMQPFIELADEGEITWSDMGKWDDWANYRYKVSTSSNSSAVKADTSYTKFPSFTGYVAVSLLPRQLEIVEASEYQKINRLVSSEVTTKMDSNTTLGEEQLELMKIETMDPPAKSKSAYNSFMEMNTELAGEELEEDMRKELLESGKEVPNPEDPSEENPRKTAKFNHNPALGYHREAHLRRDGSKADIYYHTPSGQKLRSTVDVDNYLTACENNPRYKDTVLPDFDLFCFKSPKMSDLKLYPRLDYNRLAEKLSDIYERIGDEGREKYETMAAADMVRFQEEFTRYKMWRQVKALSDKTGIYDDDLDGRRSSRKRRKVSLAPVSYAVDKHLSAYDLTTKAIRDYPKSSSILDVERHVFMSDISMEEAKKRQGMYDGTNLSVIRNTLGTLLREGRVKRVFANLVKTDHVNFFYAVKSSTPESLEELQLKQYEIHLKRTEAVLRRLILAKLQVTPEMLSASCELRDVSQEEMDDVEDDEWLAEGHDAVGKMCWRSDGLEAEVVGWVRDVETKNSNGREDPTGGGNIVQRRAMFRCKVTNAGDFYAPPPGFGPTTTTSSSSAPDEAAEKDRTEWFCSEFQVLGYIDSWELRQEAKRSEAEIHNAGVPMSTYVGRALSIAEYEYATVTGADNVVSVERCQEPKWVPATCAAVGPSDNKMLLLGDECGEGFWGRYFPETKSFIREGDEASAATEIKWEGSSATYEAALGLLEYLEAQVESYLFLEPVDHVAWGIPNYPNVIREPMDFGTIRQKLDKREYHEIDGERVDLRGSFKYDVELVFNNAIRFNGADSIIGLQTSKLQKKWLRKFPSVIGRVAAGGEVIDSDEDYDDEKDVGGESYGDAMTDEPAAKLKVRSVGVEGAHRLSELVQALPVKSEGEKFSVPDEFNVLRDTSRSGTGFLSRYDPSMTATDRVDLEASCEQRHKQLAGVYNRYIGAGGNLGGEEAETAGKKKEMKIRPMNTVVLAADYHQVKQDLADKAGNEEAAKARALEEERMSRNFQNDFCPWLGSISFATGELVWEIRKPHLLPALRYVLRGLVHSGHVFEVESIGATSASAGGGTVCVANAYMPSLPFSVIKVKNALRKKKKEEDEEEEEQVELSEYEQARAERVARNNAKLKALGLL